MGVLVRFSILGPIRVEVGERDVTITAGRERALLAALLVHPNESVPTSRLIDAVWGGQVPRSARNQLQRCIHQLRRRLSDAREVIRTEPAGYSATIRPDQLDLLEFRSSVARARTADRPAQAAAAYRSALDIWRGPALADVESDLLRQAAVALEEERARVLDERFEAEFAAGGGGELVAELTALVRQYPYRESLHGALMRALYRAGRQADALSAYQDARRLLHEDLGAEPGLELQQVHRAILTRDPSLEATRSADVAAPVVPRELPAEVAGFTGRSEVLRTLDELLPDGASLSEPVVISAIAGCGGVGKTALAIHWGHRVADRFPDGQLYINLRGYAAQAPLRPIEALATLLRSLGVQPEQVPADEAEASARYRSLLAGRRVLVVLDNARSVEQVRPLLPGGAGCLALVTSRDRLTGLVARDGARRLTLDVLTPGEAYELLARLLGRDRVEAELEATRDLAKACAYLPLAVRISAALLDEHPGRSVGALAAEVASGRRLDALAVLGDDEVAVRATFDLSYHSIPEPARRLFRLLGLVPGPDITPPAAAALGGLLEAQAQRLLDRLTAAHLLKEHAHGRYTLHDLLREYARDRTHQDDSEADRNAALTRLFRWYLGLTDAACQLIRPDGIRLPLPADELSKIPALPTDRSKAISLLDAERANLVAAARHAAERGPYRYAWLLADRLRPYLIHSMGTDGLSIGHASVAAAQAVGSWPERAAAHLCLADAGRLTGDQALARDQYMLAATLAERGEWLEGQAAAENNMAIIHIEAGRLRDGAVHLERALAINQRLGRLVSQASNLGNLGIIMCELGDLQRARDRWSRCLAIHASAGELSGVALGHANLGRASWLLGELDDALDKLELALRLLDETGNRGGRIYALRVLAGVLCDVGRPAEALRHAEVAMSLVPDTANNDETSFLLTSAGIALNLLGRREEAVRHFEQALAAGQGQQYATACALMGLGMTRRGQGIVGRAEEFVRRALEIARTVGFRVIEGQALTTQASILLDQRRFEEAVRLAEQALLLHRATGHRLGETRTLEILARTKGGRGRSA